MKFLIGLAAAALMALSSVSSVSAAESMKYGSAVKLTPVFYLPVMAAQEKGIFKKHGLDVQWFPSSSGTDMQRALAASAIQIGSSAAAADILSISRGVPVVIVGDLQSYDDFGLYVTTKSRFQKPADLKGATIGVSRFGGLEHAYGLLLAKQLSLSKDVKFISTGGITESVALLTTGKIDGVILTPSQMINLVLAKRVKRLLTMKDYLPKPWTAYTIVARKDFVQQHANTGRKIVQSIIEANRFIMSKEGRPWALAAMEKMNGYSAEGAGHVYDLLNLSTDGKMPPGALKNVTDFMVEHGLIKSTEVPQMSAIYDDALVK
jgi:ABC-type nitrate/sulfonate/bicarbonate transport system substrate-binding protein